MDLPEFESPYIKRIAYDNPVRVRESIASLSPDTSHDELLNLGRKALVVKLQVAGIPLLCAIDSLCNTTIIAEEVVSALDLDVTESDRKVSVELGDASVIDVPLRVVKDMDYSFIGLKGKCSPLVMERVGAFDMILGTDWLEAVNPDIDWVEGTVKLRLPRRNPRKTKRLGERTARAESESMLKSFETGVVSFKLMVAKTASPASGRSAKWQPLATIVAHRMTYDNSPEKERGEDDINVENQEWLSSWTKIFDKPEGLPPRREFDHDIELEADAEVKPSPLIRLSPREMAELHKQLNEMLEQGIIVPSKSPFGASVLFARKKSGGLRLCIDYRSLNAATKKDAYATPRVDNSLDRIGGHRVYSTVDLQSGFWQLRLTDRASDLSTFRTPLGSYRFLVMPFGLCNAPASFQRMMNELLLDFTTDQIMEDGSIRKAFAVIFLDDVERIVDHRYVGKRKRLDFFVKWEGYVHPDWQPAIRMFADVPKLVKAYIRSVPEPARTALVKDS